VVIVYALNGDVAALSLARDDAARRYPGQRVGGRNPQFYDSATAAPVRDAVAVYVRANWPQIIAEYAGFGIPVHIIEELAKPAAPVVRPPDPPPVTAPLTPSPPVRRGPGRPPKVSVNG
jgi:hypothetical protein